MFTTTNTKNLTKHSYFNYYFILGLFLLSLIAAVPANAATTKAANSLTEAGLVLMATTGVTAQQPNSQPRNLARRSSIYVGDTLTTPEGGRVQIRMLDGEILSLAANTQLQIESFSYQPGSKDSPDSNVKNLVTGGLRTLTGAVSGEDYQLRSRAGTIGIRGTSFEAFSQNGANLYVLMRSGSVELANNQGSLAIAANHSLPAGRIAGPNLMPQAISANELPAFFHQAFNSEPTRPAAPVTNGGESSSQEESETNQQTSATTSSVVSSYTSSPAPATPSSMQLDASSNIQEADNKTGQFEQEIENNPPQVIPDPEPPVIPNPEPPVIPEPEQPIENNPPQVIPDPEPPVIPNPEPPVTPDPEPPVTIPDLAGFVIGYEQSTKIIDLDNLIFEHEDNNYASYFQQVTATSNEPFIFSIQGNNGQIVGFNTQLFTNLDIFNFTNVYDIDKLNFDNLTPEQLAALEGSLNNLTEDNFSFGIWHKYTLGEDNVYQGLVTSLCTTSADCKSDMNFSEHEYVFATHVLNKDQLDNLVANNILTNNDYTYTLAANNWEDAMLTEAEFTVNFVIGGSGWITGFLTLGDSQQSYSFSGDIVAFYNGATALGGSGSIAGRFVGQQAEGAIAIFNLNDVGNGTVVFERNPGIPDPGIPNPVDNIDLSGFVIGYTDFITPNSYSENEAGYFEQVTATLDGSTVSFQGEGSMGELPFNASQPLSEGFNFINTVALSAAPDELLNSDGVESFYDFSTGQPTELGATDTSLGVWYKYTLGTADIYQGLYLDWCVEGNCATEISYAEHEFIFASHILSPDQIQNLLTDNILTSQEYTYNLTANNWDNSILDSSSSFTVNFFNEEIEGNLALTNGTNGSFSGSIGDFYHGMDLFGQNLRGDNSKIIGRFVGQEAEGAITIFSIHDMNQNEPINGTAVFNRDGVDINLGM